MPSAVLFWAAARSADRVAAAKASSRAAVRLHLFSRAAAIPPAVSVSAGGQGVLITRFALAAQAGLLALAACTAGLDATGG